MRQSNGSDNGGGGQRTVAELLAMYGDSAPPPSSGRRRRRREEDDEPVESTSRGVTRVVPDADEDLDRPSPTARRRTRSHAADPPTPPELRYDPLGVDALLGRGGRPGPSIDEDDRPTQFDLPAVADDVTLTQPHLFGGELAKLNETDQLPLPGGYQHGSPDLGSPTAALPVETEEDHLDEVAEVPGRESLDFSTLAAPSRPRGRRSRSAPDHDDDLDNLEPTSESEFDLDALDEDDDWDEDLDGPRPEASPLREWAVVAGQVGVGVVGGAALWLICEWLWQSLPIVALVVALGVITGLVYVVRRVRRAEDMQTTMVAVLVGLFVTVSPAALLLVDK